MYARFEAPRRGFNKKTRNARPKAKVSISVQGAITNSSIHSAMAWAQAATPTPTKSVSCGPDTHVLGSIPGIETTIGVASATDRGADARKVLTQRLTKRTRRTRRRTRRTNKVAKWNCGFTQGSARGRGGGVNITA